SSRLTTGCRFDGKASGGSGRMKPLTFSHAMGSDSQSGHGGVIVAFSVTGCPPVTPLMITGNPPARDALASGLWQSLHNLQRQVRRGLLRFDKYRTRRLGNYGRLRIRWSLIILIWFLLGHNESLRWC